MSTSEGTQVVIRTACSFCARPAVYRGGERTNAPADRDLYCEGHQYLAKSPLTTIASEETGR